MANNLDSFKKFDVSVDNQAKAVDQNKLDSYDIREINSERNALAREIRQAAEFNDDEKQYYFEKLSNEIDDTDLSAVRQFKVQVEKDRREIRGMIDAYTGIINKNRDAFGVDKNRGLDAADQYIEEFMRLDYNGKKEWLGALESDIEERLELLSRAKELMPDKGDYLRTLRRSEVRELVKELDKSKSYIKEGKKIFTENPEAFSEEEREELLAGLEDSTRHDQARTLNSIRTELKERKEMAASFKSLPEKYRSMASGFNDLTLDQRRTSMEKIEAEITNDYRNMQRNHPLSRHISEEGKDEAYAYFKECSIADKVEALNMLEKQFKTEKELSDTYEQLLKTLSKSDKTANAEKLRVKFYKADYTTKKDELIPELEDQIEENRETAEEEKTLTESYVALLNEAFDNKYIGGKTRRRSLAKWKKEGMDYKNETLENFDDLIAPYVALFERFEELPDNLKKENKEFFESGLMRKKEIIARLENLAKKTDEKDEKENDEHVDKADSPEKNGKNEIRKLTRLATDAEREDNYEEALEHYEEILEINPHDPIARSRVVYLKSMTAANDNNNGDNKENDLIREAMNAEKIKKEREYYTVVSVAADETTSSEAQHGTIEAAKRQKDAEDKEVAEALYKYSEGNSVLNKEGEAEEVLEINVDKDNISREDLARLKRPVVSDIIKSSDPTAAKNIQFRNLNGQKLGGTEGEKQADHLEEKIKDEITGNVEDIAARRKMQIDEDKISEILEKKDLQKLDMTG